MLSTKPKVLDLFSGIGGFSLGLHRAGYETIAFCEIDTHCQKVLKKNFPGIPIFSDIKELSGEQFKGNVDVICGGFPCQSVSIAGNKEGLANLDKSGLWYEYKRIIKETQPKFIIIENVRNLLNLGFVEVIQGLSEIGYDCCWEVISARSIGAPHLRERIWIIAYPTNTNLSGFWDTFTSEKEKSEWWTKATSSFRNWWKTEPGICRVDARFSGRMDKPRQQRIKQLGNSVVPQIVELIGKKLLTYL